jgi:hypothetical protein
MKTLVGVLSVGLFFLVLPVISFAMCLKSKEVSGGEDHTMRTTTAIRVFKESMMTAMD